MTAERRPSAEQARVLEIRCGPQSELEFSFGNADRTMLESFYKDLVTGLSKENSGFAGWWACWLSSRDRYLSQLWDQLVFLHRLGLGLAERPFGLCICVPTLELAQAARALAGTKGWQTRISPRSRARLVLNRIRADAIRMARLLKTAGHALAWIRLSKRHGPRPDAMRGCRKIIVTMIGPGIDAAEPYRDAYFGRLHEYFRRQNIDAVYCANLHAPPRQVLPRIGTRLGDAVVYTFGHFLRPLDVLAEFVRSLYSPFRVRSVPAYGGLDIRSLVRRDLHLQAPAIMQALVLRHAARRLLDAAPEAEVVHMFENNPWERAIYAEAARRTPRRRTLGFLHCAVLPSHFKNYIAPEEWGLRPMPSRIVCTGEAASAVLSRLGHYPADTVLAGCDLRGPALSTFRPRRTHPPEKPLVILLLLEGLASMWKAVSWARSASAMDPSLRFRIREHPAMNLRNLSRITGRDMALAPGVELDPSRPLPDALNDAGIVAYVSTTASLYAVYLGIPLVKLLIDDAVIDDPLFECGYLKRVARGPQDLVSAVHELASMDQQRYEQEASAAERYVRMYLREPDEDSMAVFLHSGNSNR